MSGSLKRYEVQGLIVSARTADQAKRAARAIWLSAQRPVINKGSKR